MLPFFIGGGATPPDDDAKWLLAAAPNNNLEVPFIATGGGGDSEGELIAGGDFPLGFEADFFELAVRGGGLLEDFLGEFF